MRVNVYTQELTNEAEVVETKYISSRTGKEVIIRIYLKSHPNLHYIPGRDDDRSAVTFWCGSERENIIRLLSTWRARCV